MSLATYVVERTTIPLKPPNKDISIRGLNIVDLTAIIGDHLTDVEALYSIYQAMKVSIYSQNTLNRFIVEMLKSAPHLVAEVISRAADEPAPEAIQNAQKLPLPVQVACLNAVVRLTFEEVGGLKNLLATLGLILNGMLSEKSGNSADSEPPQNQTASPQSHPPGLQ